MSRIDGKVIGYPGQDQVDIVNTRALLTGADEAIDLSVDCSTITIGAEGADIYLNLTNTTASNANFKIPSGTSYTYQGPPIRKFHLLGSVNTGYKNICAY